MKRIIAILAVMAMLTAVFVGCNNQEEPKPTETTTQEITETETETETEEVSETEEETTEATTSTDEFPTETEETTVVDTNNYTEPQNRWSVNIPSVWDKYGKVIEDPSGKYVKFVYKKAYDEYQAGHVFTINTVDAANKVDVTQYPHAEEVYLDKNIQIYVMYPTDVQFGGIDGSEMDTQSVEYGKLKNTTDVILDSLKVL